MGRSDTAGAGAGVRERRMAFQRRRARRALEETSQDVSRMLHGARIFTHMWVIYEVNVSKYSIPETHGYGKKWDKQEKPDETEEHT